MASGGIQEEGAQPEEQQGYYNIMLIGTTGQGKSTTADKLLIANPNQHHYEGGLPQREPVLNEQHRQLQMDDITMWLLHASSEVPDDSGGKLLDQDNLQCAKTRVKCLVYFRNKDDPHKKVNDARDSKMKIFTTTKECEVLSNETSKVRVMDVPGFFDATSLRLKGRKPDSLINSLQINNLDIMRRIVRIQTTLGMKFHRILYFLPSRGPLERANAHLKLELEWMKHYFGKHIFQCMVLVATVPSYISEDEDYPEHKKFPEKVVKATKAIFREALEEVFLSTCNDDAPSDNDVPDPPLIFISLTDSCEKILEKVKGAYDADVRLNLEFDPKTCAHCGVKISMVKGQRVTCHFQSNTIPYEESTCHPRFVAKYTRADKVWGEFKHVVLFKWVKNPWPVFTGEECANCKGDPNSSGCMQVGSTFQFKLKKEQQTITVDHTNKFDDDEDAIVIELPKGGAGVDNEQPTNDPPANGPPVQDANEPPPANQQHAVQESLRQADGIDQHRQSGQGVVAVGGLEANVAHLNLHSRHVPHQSYPVESHNPCFDQKGT